MRYTLADRIVDLAKCMEREAVFRHLSDVFAEFLQDSESEVRTMATSRIAQFCTFLDGEVIIRKVVPALKKLSTDPFVHVRSTI